MLLLFGSCIFASCSSDDNSNLTNSNRPSLDFSEVITFQVDTLELDMISSDVENAFFITYSADNGFNESVLKYEVATNSQTGLVHPDISESRQIEIINNYIYSISSNDIYKFDLNLNNLLNINSSYNNAIYSRATKFNNDLLYFYSDKIGSFNINSESYNSVLSISPYDYRDQNDGEIVNDIVYMFGGRQCDSHEDFENNTCDSFNEINIYNIH